MLNLNFDNYSSNFSYFANIIRDHYKYFNIFYWKRSVMQGWERAIYTVSVGRPQPHHTNQLKERRENENCRRQRETESLRTIKKTLALLWKPASPTPSNTGSARSFNRYNERVIKAPRHYGVMQRGGASTYTARRLNYTERNKWYILTHLCESGYCLQINPNYQVNWPNCWKFSGQWPRSVKFADMKITI